ncbi:alkaline phosphatase [Halosquirtibacter xylanolyticus]|uniref:alkaline phosphatase n=1 Tax=Halosquirtibacter xylanolyticus TaxID=3374599 RepID=UPI003748ACAA|nr:alkaline phosphatase [Prolixibacteraceae bacterium]
MRQLCLHMKWLGCLCLLFFTTNTFAQKSFPKKIILMIGDGMGQEEVKAAHIYNGGPLSFEKMPYQGFATTHCFDRRITDSAASGTALATGRKTNYHTVGRDENQKVLTNIVEYYQSQGRSTGVVTTAYVTHATPAAFTAHQPKRSKLKDIAQDILKLKPNVLMGGSKILHKDDAEAVGYYVAETKEDFNKSIQLNKTPHFAALWPTKNHMPYEKAYRGKEYPYAHLSEMTTKAVEILDQDPDGFFLMVEGARVDHAGHGNNIKNNVFETLEFANAVQRVLDWAKDRDDVLILVTADHETGSLLVKKDNGKGKIPSVTWGTRGHSFLPVRVCGYGDQAKAIHNKVIDNIDVNNLMVPNGPINPVVNAKNKPVLTCSNWALAGGYTFISSPSDQRIKIDIKPATAVLKREEGPYGERIYWAKNYQGEVTLKQTNGATTKTVTIYSQPDTAKTPTVSPSPIAGKKSTLKTKHALAATEYQWTITPKKAYLSISPNSNEAQVVWNKNYKGKVTVEITTKNNWAVQPIKTKLETNVQ